VALRLPEIGIRTALGATPSVIFRLLRKRGMRPVLFGLALGTGLALPGTRLLAGQLYGVGTLDPVTFGLASLILASIGLLACRMLSVKAATADPVRLLRSE
jgi:ABC-type antimicrobial peptide transport system permease subunit